MSGYLLDTNVWIGLLKDQPQLVAAVRRHGIEQLYLCAPVWAELWFGACHSQRIAENQSRLRDLSNRVHSLPFDDPAAQHCGEIRAQLTRTGQLIGAYDLQIAAIARARDLVMVTRNVSEFQRVPGLTVQNWHPARPAVNVHVLFADYPDSPSFPDQIALSLASQLAK